MAEDNIAIRISDFDSNGAVYNSTTEDIEAGSPYDDQEESLLPKSIKSSSTVESAKTILGHIWSGIKWFLSNTKFFWIVVIYSIIGAWAFMWIEGPVDLESKLEKRQYHLIARDVLLHNIRLVHNESKGDMEYKWKEAIIQYEENMGIEMPPEETAWTFWMSILYAGTIYTTIGYGNIACATTSGRVVSILYGFIGIPMMIIVLDRLGDFLLKLVKRLNGIFEDLALFIGVKTRLMRIKSEKSLKRYYKVSKKFALFGFSGSISKDSVNIVTPEKKFSDQERAETSIEIPENKSDKREDERRDPPVMASLIFTILWVVASSAVFCIWEDWSYGTSVYFFIISTSTIGFGDVTPEHPEYMMAAFGVVIVGLSLVSVCINVAQEWLQNWYIALLQRMLEQYIENQGENSENAAKGFMKGFNSQARFLMPLISKNTGIRVMEQIKKEAVARGIELPPALTELNPETGKPAFLGASNAQIDQIIEKAQSEGKLTPTILNPPMSAMSIRASIFGEPEVAQTQTEISWQFFESRINEAIQVELPPINVHGISVEVDARPNMRNTGIQPEVSFILQLEPSRIEKMELEKVVLANREAPEGVEVSLPEMAEQEADKEMGFLRFLKSTGTQVEIEVNEFGLQTEEKVIVDSEAQVESDTSSLETQTEEVETRTMRTQTKLTTCVQNPEDLEKEKVKLREERKNEFRQQQEERAKAEGGIHHGKRRIILDEEEKKILKEKLVKLRIEEAKEHKLKGTPLVFDVKGEKNVLLGDLKKIRKKKGKPMIYERKQRKRTEASASASSIEDDDVFLESDPDEIQRQHQELSEEIDPTLSPASVADAMAAKTVLHPGVQPQLLSQPSSQTQPHPSHQKIPQHHFIPRPDAFAQLLAAALLRGSTSSTATESGAPSTSASVGEPPGAPSPPSIIEREDGSRIEIAEGIVTYYNSEGQPVLRQEGFFGDPAQLLNEVAKIQEMIQMKKILSGEIMNEGGETEVKDFKEQLHAILREIGIMPAEETEEIQQVKEPLRGEAGMIGAETVESQIAGVETAEGVAAPEGLVTTDEAGATKIAQAPSTSKSRKATRVQSGPIILTPKEILGLEPAPLQSEAHPQAIQLPQQHRLRAPFESLSRESQLEIPAFEIHQTPTDEYYTDENVVEVTLDVELIRVSRSTMSSISAAGANYASTSSAEELPIEELEDLIDYDDLFNELDINDEQDEIELFMDSIGVQTDLSFFDRKSEGMVTDPEKHTFGVQTDLTALDETKGPHSLAVALLPKQATSVVQTSPIVTSEAIQTDAETHDKCIGGEVDYESTEVQTTEKEFKDASNEPHVKKEFRDSFSEPHVIQISTAVQGDLQTEMKKEHVQVGTEAVSHATEAIPIEPEIKPLMSQSSMQTDEKSFTSSEAQAVVETYETQSQAVIEKSFVDSEAQAVVETYETQSQAVIEKSFVDSEAQAVVETSETETQAVVDTSATESQAIVDKNFIDSEAQAVVDTSETESQTAIDTTDTESQAFVDSTDTESQAVIDTSESSTSTEIIVQERKAVGPDIQTETIDSDSQTELSSTTHGVSALEIRIENTAIQPETSTFYPRGDSPIDDDVRYLVDKSTEQDYDLVMQDATTQHRIAHGDFAQQHSPNVTNASSQYDYEMQHGEKVMQTGPYPRTESPEKQQSPAHIIPKITYWNTAMQTEKESRPVIIDASVSLTSPYESSSGGSYSEESYYDEDEEEQAETEPHESEKGSVHFKANIPLFFVESVTLTQDAETQVNFINIDVETQIEKGDFNQDIETQADISLMDRQTSLHSEDLEPLESGFSYGGPISAVGDLGFLWSDFDFVPPEDEFDYEEGEDYDEEERAEEERQISPEKEEEQTWSMSFLPAEEKRARSASPQQRKRVEDERERLRPKSKMEISLSDLDASRRERMMDIGIQTGVLARVQHMYGKGKSSASSGQESAATPGVQKITLRKPPKEGLSTPSTSEPSLEQPGSSAPRIRPMLPPPTSIESAKMTAFHGRYWEKQNSVSDLRSKLEKMRQTQSSGNLFGPRAGGPSSLQIFGTETAGGKVPPPTTPPIPAPLEEATKEDKEKKEKSEDKEKEEKQK